MPELLEVESYRRLAEAVVGRTISAVDAPDAWFVKGGEPAELEAALPGRRVAAVRRRGKLLVLDLDDGTRLGLRFGMTGRLLVDGAASIERLEYSSGRDEPAWDRFGLRFGDGTELRIRDPRRLGGVSLDPDEDRLGPDALVVTRDELATALGSSTAPLKARLLDQARLAGVGNLLADEALWLAKINPAQRVNELSRPQVDRLFRAVRRAIDSASADGGVHTLSVVPSRKANGVCARCGAPMSRGTVGDRTTWWCSREQG